ncbi:MAG: hypothetical protein ACYTEX_22150 [Planctomycetota bacterium]|jgi:hypothetical protein
MESQTEIDERRFRRVQIQPEFLMDLLKTSREPWRFPVVTCEGLPADAEFVRGAMIQTPFGNCELHLIVRSAEFEPVPEAAVIPEMRPQFTECSVTTNDGSNPNSPKTES